MLVQNNKQASIKDHEPTIESAVVESGLLVVLSQACSHRNGVFSLSIKQDNLYSLPLL
jgi:hypothetical protein